MKSYTQTYLNYFDLGLQSEIQCELCMKTGRVDGEGFDLHHVWGRIGNKLTDIKNIMCLCMHCHEKVHAGVLSKSELQLVHNNVMQGNRKIFLK